MIKPLINLVTFLLYTIITIFPLILTSISAMLKDCNQFLLVTEIYNCFLVIYSRGTK